MARMMAERAEQAHEGDQQRSDQALAAGRSARRRRDRRHIAAQPQQEGHGHAANHLCLLLEEDGLLFSGDHILNGSTTVVDPPDGDMSAYLDSLAALDTACAEHDAHFILPAHGHVLGQARAAIARLKAHRLQREAKVLRAMQALPAGSLDDWVARAYDDVPERMWPLAKRSLLAHVQRLQTIGGGEFGAIWQFVN